MAVYQSVRRVRIEVAHVDVDDVALGVEVETPDVLGDHRPAQHAPGVAQEVLEERVLPRRELDATPAARHRACRGIEGEVVEAERRQSALSPAPEQRADARQELLERKRLRHVVVGAAVEAGHLVRDAVPRR